MGSIKNYTSGDIKNLKKIYKNYLKALLKITIKKLPDYATVVYLTLNDLAEAGFWYPGSNFSVKHAINNLEESEFIKPKSENHFGKKYLPKHKNKKTHVIIISAQPEDYLPIEKMLNKPVDWQILMSFVNKLLFIFGFESLAISVDIVLGFRPSSAREYDSIFLRFSNFIDVLLFLIFTTYS